MIQYLSAFLVALVVVFSTAPALTTELSVYPGCDQPGQPGAGRKFYIDPVRGGMSNDGTAEHPWRTLAEVVRADSHLISSRTYVDYAKGDRTLRPVNPNGPVKSGDTLVLMSGDHGAVDLRSYLNEDFIYVVAGAGQKPIVRATSLLSSSHWFFQELKFQAVRPENERYNGLVQVLDNGFFGPGDNIIFNSNSFSAEDDISGWRDIDWVNKAYDYAFTTSTRCTTLTKNHFYHAHNGLALEGDDSLVGDNLIEKFGNDGIDVTGSNITLRGNTIRGVHHTAADPSHPDGIQGWTLKGKTNRNLLVESNVVINADRTEANDMQGISIFDGRLGQCHDQE